MKLHLRNKIGFNGNGLDLADEYWSTKQWRLGELANSTLRVFLRSKLDDPDKMHQIGILQIMAAEHTRIPSIFQSE
jgi:hypothetical protein